MARLIRRARRGASLPALTPTTRALGAAFGYARRLRQVARIVGEIVSGHLPPYLPPAGESNLELVMPTSTIDEIVLALRAYADLLPPWALSVASVFVDDVERRNARAWHDHARAMGQALRLELRAAPTRAALAPILAEQVQLITSLPLEAATRVQGLAWEARVQGKRPAALVEEIMRTGEVTRSRAETIARTEVSKTATNLTQVRAESIGSVAYVWRTASDNSVRESHRKMEGKVVNWSNPPTLDGLTGHAGCLPNCRCYPEVIIPQTLSL